MTDDLSPQQRSAITFNRTVEADVERAIEYVELAHASAHRTEVTVEALGRDHPHYAILAKFSDIAFAAADRATEAHDAADVNGTQYAADLAHEAEKLLDRTWLLITRADDLTA